MTIWRTGSTLLLAVGLLPTYWIHAGRSLDIVVDPAPPVRDGPLISVCIPARNEGRMIASCIEAFFSRTYPKFEVIVVDDGSTDATPDILEAQELRFPTLRVLPGAPLPPDWAGKPHALYQAAAATQGPWLCFLDADTVLMPQALASCYTKAVETQADLFTIMTHQVSATSWERVLMPIVFTSLAVGFPARRVNAPQLPDAIANGQFMLMRRSAYDAVGGHAAIKREIVDDQAMAEPMKQSGHRLVLADGHRMGQTRMYTSLPEMWEGWTKNICLGLRYRPATLALGLFGALLLAGSAILLPLWPLLGIYLYEGCGGWGASVVVLESLLLWATVLYARAMAADAMGIPRGSAWSTPPGCGLFAAMMLFGVEGDLGPRRHLARPNLSRSMKEKQCGALGWRLASSISLLRSPAQHDLVHSPVDFPGVNDERVGDGGVVVRASRAEQAAIRIEVEHARLGESPSGGYPVLDRRDRAPRSPHIIDDEGGSTAQLVV